MALKPVKVVYNSRNYITGLSDVTANIFRHNGVTFVSVASNVVLSEIDATNMAGLYLLSLTPAQLTGFGGSGTYLIKINSASQSAPATMKLDIILNNEDDLEAHLTILETKIDQANSALSTLASEIASVKATGQSTNAVIVDPIVGNANIKALIEQVISAVQSVQNNTSFVAVIPSQLIVMGSGANAYKIPMRVFNTQGNLEDPDLNHVFVSIKNEAGLDRTNLLVGFTSGPVQATRISKGIYEIGLSIPDTASLEQLIFEFTYTENAVALNHVRTAETVEEAQATGLALQATLLDVLTDTSDMVPRVIDIQSKVNDPITGLSAIKALIDIVTGVANDSKAELVSSLHGLAVLKTAIDTKSSQASVDAIATAITDFKGAGFDGAKDSLKAISDRSFYGGTAI